MLRYALAAALLLSIPAGVVAQSDVTTGSQQDPQAAYQVLSKSYAKAMSAWQDELEATITKAKEAGERVPRSAYAPPSGDFVSTAQEHAKEYAGTDAAVPFLGFILKNATRERNAVSGRSRRSRLSTLTARPSATSSITCPRSRAWPVVPHVRCLATLLTTTPTRRCG